MKPARKDEFTSGGAVLSVGGRCWFRWSRPRPRPRPRSGIGRGPLLDHVLRVVGRRRLATLTWHTIGGPGRPEAIRSMRLLGIGRVLALPVGKSSLGNACVWVANRWRQVFLTRRPSFQPHCSPCSASLRLQRRPPDNVHMSSGEYYSLTATEQQILQQLDKGASALPSAAFLVSVPPHRGPAP